MLYATMRIGNNCEYFLFQSKHDLLVGFGVDLITVDLVDNNWENATVNLLEKMEQNIQARR